MSQPMMGSRMEKRRRSDRKIWRWLTALTLLLAFATGAAVYWFIKPTVSAKGIISDGVIDSIPGRTNVLVMGVDARKGDVGRSDSMVLVSIDGKGKPFLLSIPRDTRVKIQGHDYDKINAAFAYGGPRLATQTVSQFTGVPIDGYIVVNIQAFEQIVDALGGVDLDVEKRMYYVDPYQSLTIDLKPGMQHLNGEKAMEYVRFRHDETGDIGRVQRQQKFLQAVAKEAMSVKNITKLPAFIKECYDAVDTNLSIAQLTKLATVASKGASGGLNTEMLPGVGQYVGDVSYYLPDVKADRQLISDRMLADQDTTAYDTQTNKLINDYDRSLKAEQGSSESTNTSGSKPTTGTTQPGQGGTQPSTPSGTTTPGTTKPGTTSPGTTTPGGTTNPGGTGNTTPGTGGQTPPTNPSAPKVELFDASGRNLVKNLAQQLTSAGFNVMQAITTTQQQSETMVVVYSQDPTTVNKIKAQFPQAKIVQQVGGQTDVAATIILGTNYK